MPSEDDAIELSVSQFVALLNQTLEFAYPSVVINGELANFRVSKNRWVYLDLKDEQASVKCFGTVYHLPGPLEDGMLLKVRGQPRLHNLYGFSVNILSLQPAGEGSIRRAADLLRAKLTAEGLFAEERKRRLPYPPVRIGLITSSQSAAYADFVKILQARWAGLDIRLIDVQVQGEAAPGQIVQAIEQFNAEAEPPEALVIIRGGGSPEDLAAFSNEQVTRAVAASRAPTLVAIGHEVDLSLAELAADMRASTPSNAAELLVPDRRHELQMLQETGKRLGQYLSQQVITSRGEMLQRRQDLEMAVSHILEDHHRRLELQRQLLAAFDPRAALKRGYAVIRSDNRLINSVKRLQPGQAVNLEFSDGSAGASITSINPKK